MACPSSPERGALLPWEPAPAPGDDPCGALAFGRFLDRARSERQIKALAFSHANGELVGQISLNESVLGPFCSGYLGWWIGAPFLGRGLVVEGIGAFIDHAFGECGLHRVEANVQPTNTASMQVVRRLGFRREGFSPRYLKIAGRWADHERWALTTEDRRA